MITKIAEGVEFQINYKECKWNISTKKFQIVVSFRLTIRNVNAIVTYESFDENKCFRLTIRNVNIRQSLQF